MTAVSESGPSGKASATTGAGDRVLSLLGKTFVFVFGAVPIVLIFGSFFAYVLLVIVYVLTSGTVDPWDVASW